MGCRCCAAYDVAACGVTFSRSREAGQALVDSGGEEARALLAALVVTGLQAPARSTVDGEMAPSSLQLHVPAARGVPAILAVAEAARACQEAQQPDGHMAFGHWAETLTEGKRDSGPERAE